MSSSGLPPHLDPRGRHHGEATSRTYAWRPIVRIVVSVVSIGLVVLAGVVWYQFRDLDKGITRLAGIHTGPQRDQSGSEAADIDGTDQNILIVGNDDRSNMTNAEVRELRVGRDGGSLATDTMMIVHIPADGSRASLISLPRDTEVNVPGYGMNMLNAPYALAYTNTRGSEDVKRTAGANLLLATIHNLTGLSFDHYVQVDLLGFYRISKAIGGVPVTLCRNVNDTVAYNARVRNEVGGSGLVLPKGRHVISGVQALEFVRQRHGLPRGDFDRVKRQQYFLTAAFRQVASAGILFKIRDLGDALRRSVYFDGSLNLLDLARQVENLTADNIIGRTIPVNINNGYTNPAQVKKFVQNVIHPKPVVKRPGSSKASSSSSKAPTTKRPAVDAKCIN